MPSNGNILIKYYFRAEVIFMKCLKFSLNLQLEAIFLPTAKLALFRWRLEIVNSFIINIIVYICYNPSMFTNYT